MNKLITVAIKSLNTVNDMAGVIENAIKAAPSHALFGAFVTFLTIACWSAAL